MPTNTISAGQGWWGLLQTQWHQQKHQCSSEVQQLGSKHWQQHHEHPSEAPDQLQMHRMQPCQQLVHQHPSVVPQHQQSLVVPQHQQPLVVLQHQLVLQAQAQGQPSHLACTPSHHHRHPR